MKNALETLSRLAARLPDALPGTTAPLLALMALSYLCGVAAAVFGKGHAAPAAALGPRALLTPLSRRAVELCVVALCALVDAQLGTQALGGAASLFYLAVEALSLLDSALLLGVPVPKKLRDALDALKLSKGGREE